MLIHVYRLTHLCKLCLINGDWFVSLEIKKKNRKEKEKYLVDYIQKPLIFFSNFFSSLQSLILSRNNSFVMENQVTFILKR